MEILSPYSVWESRYPYFVSGSLHPCSASESLYPYLCQSHNRQYAQRLSWSPIESRIQDLGALHPRQVSVERQMEEIWTQSEPKAGSSINPTHAFEEFDEFEEFEKFEWGPVASVPFSW